jgi:antitoxin (DNA-binding transcriptional repressor) of toxin-antitoxin stability system
MKTLALSKATAPLSEYARNVREEPVLLTDRGRAVAALVPINNSDVESIALSTNPDFIAMIEASRRRQRIEGGIPLAEVRREFGLPATVSPRPRKPRGPRATKNQRRPRARRRK